jgi:toxin ParE1/3/4
VKVRLSTAARAELRQAVAYYERQRNGLGIEFLAAVLRTMEQIGEWPLAGRIIDWDVRERIVRRFSYWLIYGQVDSSIWIIAVAHQSRDPDYWRSRWEVREPETEYLRLAA